MCKKLLYAGCQQVMLDYADPVQLELTKEVSLKFGKEKIAAGVADISLLEQEKELLKEYTSNVIFVLSRCNGGGCADVSGFGGNHFAGGFPGKAHRGAFLCQYQR